ncbi:MAG: putative toxin-antitoxin system toxin component, PIN family [Nitrososphaerales archaeon]|nr:putative toxin-antitoxin system toxin component, PIN family [Nitrososphaerales archaeon]
MVRVVVDTNVLVSAFIGRGKPRRLLLKLLEAHSMVLSRQMLAELADVLSREKFSDVRNSQVDRFLSSLVSKSKVVTVRSSFKVIEEDPDDDIVLNTAHGGKADYIVTGDRHLLALKSFKGIEIVKATQMLEIIR